MRGNTGLMAAVFEGDKIIFDKLGPNDTLISDSGKNRIGRHEGCEGDVSIFSDQRECSLSCERVMLCHFEVKKIPLSVDTPLKLKAYLRDFSYLG